MQHQLWKWFFVVHLYSCDIMRHLVCMKSCKMNYLSSGAGFLPSAVQGVPRLVINGVITPINGLINAFLWFLFTPVSGVITLPITGFWARLVPCPRLKCFFSMFSPSYRAGGTPKSDIFDDRRLDLLRRAPSEPHKHT